MSKCSKKCNEIKEKIHSISGLDDDIVYKWLLALEKIVDATVTMIEDYADLDELNGTCFKTQERETIDIFKLSLKDTKQGKEDKILYVKQEDLESMAANFDVQTIEYGGKMLI